MRKIISILICMSIIMSSIDVVFASENSEKLYNTISVEFSDNIGKLEKLQVMVEKNKVYANAEELGIRLGYDIKIFDEYIVIYNQDIDENVPLGMSIFYYDSTKVGHMLFNQMVDSYEAPYATLKNEYGVWIPLEFSLLLLNSSMLIVDDVILVDMPSKKIIDIYMDICKDNQKYLFDWQEDIGLSLKRERVMQNAAFVATLFDGILNKDEKSWIQFAQCVVLDDTAYESKYGEELAMLFCTYSADELEKSAKTVKEKMSYINGKGALGKAINEIDKELDKNIDELLATSKELRSKIDVNNNASIVAYSRAYQAFQNACNKKFFFSNTTEFYKKVGEEVSKETSFLDKFYKVSEVVGYASEFDNQDKFAVSALLKFVDSSNSQSAMSKAMKKSISDYAGILQTDIVAYSALRYLENNYSDWIFEKIDLSSGLGLPANLMLIGWDVAKDKIPFYEKGLRNTDNYMLSMYAGIFQADALKEYQTLRNRIFNDVNNITPENLYEVSQYCYTYLKACYITRNAALGSLTDDTKKDIPSLIEYQNSINEEIAEYLVQLKNAEITNERGCYGFLPEDNVAYLEDYTGENLLNLFSEKKGIIEITDFIGNFQIFVDDMNMCCNETMSSQDNNYYIVGLSLKWNDKGDYFVSNTGNENISMYGICIGDSKKDVLSKIQQCGYVHKREIEGGNIIYVLDGKEMRYVEIFYDGGLVCNWYISNHVEGENTIEIKNVLKMERECNVRNLESWKIAYIDFILEYGIEYDSFFGNYIGFYKLVNIDDDYIPELYINHGSVAGGDTVCSYYDDAIIHQDLYSYGFSYLEGENLFIDSGGRMDTYHDIIYSIENGKFVVKHSGYYGAEDNSNAEYDLEGYPLYDYYWNGSEVSGEFEYEKLLGEVFDMNQAKNPYGGLMYNYQEIIKMIIEY